MKKPIVIMVIIHNDLQDYPRDKLTTEYFTWFQTELEEISGRPVFIYMSDKHDVPELADYSYRTDVAKVALEGWSQQVKSLHASMLEKENFHSHLIKILLLTRYNINEVLGGLAGGTRGIAYFKGYAGIAAITSSHVPAHEIGHMLGATHEHSDVIYDGWWHDTIMRVDEGSVLRGNSYRFSDRNRQNIRDYLDQFP